MALGDLIHPVKSSYINGQFARGWGVNSGARKLTYFLLNFIV